MPEMVGTCAAAVAEAPVTLSAASICLTSFDAAAAGAIFSNVFLRDTSQPIRAVQHARIPTARGAADLNVFKDRFWCGVFNGLSPEAGIVTIRSCRNHANTQEMVILVRFINIGTIFASFFGLEICLA